MPRTKLSEYSTTNSSNTDIEGINIDEGCAPSGINNAIRELMVHLKEFQTGASGDAFTFAGGVLISGTANTITGNVLMSGTNTITGSTTATFAAGAVGTPSIAAHGDTNTGIFFPAADTIAFAEGGAEAMRINSSGNVGIGRTPSYLLDVNGTARFNTTIGVGNTAPSSSGAGITFPATQSASTDANTLDDYEEGTWTFGISFGGGTTGITYAQTAGSYTKIGHMVTVRGYMELTNKGSSTGDAVITGLPFSVTAGTANHTACGLAMKNVTFADWPNAWAAPGTSTIILAELTNAGVQTALTNADFVNNSWVMVSCSYYTS